MLRLFVVTVFACASPATAPCDTARAAVSAWDLASDFDLARMRWQPALQALFCREVLANLAERLTLGPASPRDVASRTIAFESFRLETFLATGVVPKRYFGFFDARGDTADDEIVLRQTIIAAVAIANRYAGHVRVTEMEAAVTFIAEGGARMLMTRAAAIDRLDPVSDIGLDGFRAESARHRDLIAALDRELGTTLARAGANHSVMTFREAIAATVFMYLIEKERTARLMSDRTLADLPLAEQFVTSSLVYNAGILFSRERIAQIVQLSTGNYLVGVNADNFGKRPALPVFTLDTSLTAPAYPAQPTSWNAVYHVLQRYGAWVALARDGVFFDESGAFRER